MRLPSGRDGGVRGDLANRRLRRLRWRPVLVQLDVTEIPTTALGELVPDPREEGPVRGDSSRCEDLVLATRPEADYDAVPDVDELADGIERAVARLVAISEGAC